MAMKALVVAVLGILLGAATPCAAQRRWQLTLHSDAVLWDLEFVRLAGDTLVVRHTDTDATLRIPVMQIDELRLVRKSARRPGEPARTVEAGLLGTDDLAFRLTLRDRAERLEIIRGTLPEEPPAGP